MSTQKFKKDIELQEKSLDVKNDMFPEVDPANPSYMLASPTSRNSIINQKLSKDTNKFLCKIVNVNLRKEIESLMTIFQGVNDREEKQKVVNILYYIYDVASQQGLLGDNNKDPYVEQQKPFDFVIRKFENQFRKWGGEGDRYIGGNELTSLFNDMDEALRYLENKKFKNIQKFIVNEIDPTYHEKFEQNEYILNMKFLSEKECKSHIIALIRKLINHQQIKIAKRLIQKFSSQRMVENKFLKLKEEDVEDLEQVLSRKYVYKSLVDKYLKSEDGFSAFLFHFTWVYGRTFLSFPADNQVVVYIYITESYKFFQRYCYYEDFNSSHPVFIEKVIDNLRCPTNFIHGLFGLNFLCLDGLKDQQVNVIIKELQNISVKNTHFIHMTNSPFQTVMTLSKTCEKMRGHFQRQSIQFEDLRNSFIELAILLQDNIKDYLVLESSYLEIVYPATESPYDVILQYEQGFQKLIEADFFEMVTWTQFRGKHQFKGVDFFMSSSAYKSFQEITQTGGHLRKMLIEKNKKKKGGINQSAAELQTVEDSNGDQLLNKNDSNKYKPINQNGEHHDEDESFSFMSYRTSSQGDLKKKNNCFSFQIWKQSPYMFTVVNWIVYLMVNTYIIVINLVYLGLIQDQIQLVNLKEDQSIIKLDELYIQNCYENTSQQKLRDFLTEQKKKNTDPILDDYLLDLTLMCNKDKYDVYEEILGGDLADEIKLIEDHEKQMDDETYMFQFIAVYYMLTFMSSVMEIVNLTKTRYTIDYLYRHFIDAAQLGIQLYQGYLIMFIIENAEVSWHEKKNTMKTIETFVAVNMFLILLKLLQMMKLAKRFGILIKIIELCVIDIINFTAVFIVQMLAFTAIFYSLYSSLCYVDGDGQEQCPYQGYTDTLVALNNAVLGNYDSDFNLDSNSEKILTFAFVYLNNILFINLLVAILSNTFQQVFDQGNAAYGKIIHSETRFLQPSRNFTSLVSLPAPFNIIILPFQMVQCMINSRKLNIITLYTAYSTLVILLLLPIYLVCNLAIFIPLGWLNHLVTIANKEHQSIIKKILDFFFWLIFGILIMIFAFFVNDLKLFFNDLFLPTTAKQKLEEFDGDHLRNLQHICKLLLDQKMNLSSKKDEYYLKGVEFQGFIKQIDYETQQQQQYDIILNQFLTYNDKIHYGEMLHILKTFHKFSMNAMHSKIWFLAFYNSKWTSKALIKYKNDVEQDVRPDDGDIDELECRKNDYSSKKNQ